jgi:hypothetical protein
MADCKMPVNWIMRFLRHSSMALFAMLVVPLGSLAWVLANPNAEAVASLLGATATIAAGVIAWIATMRAASRTEDAARQIFRGELIRVIEIANGLAKVSDWIDQELPRTNDLERLLSYGARTFRQFVPLTREIEVLNSIARSMPLEEKFAALNIVSELEMLCRTVRESTDQLSVRPTGVFDQDRAERLLIEVGFHLSYLAAAIDQLDTGLSARLSYYIRPVDRPTATERIDRWQDSFEKSYRRRQGQP